MQTGGLGALLTAAEEASPVESVDVTARDLQARFAARDVSFLLVDIVGERVVRLARTPDSGDGRGSEQIPLPGSPYEQVLHTQRPWRAAVDGGVRVVLPVTNRGDCLGVLELTVPSLDDAALAELGEAAHALAYIIVTDRRFTDLYHFGERTTPVNLAAEIQHQLLPSADCCEAAQFTIAGALVPADQIGGDTYDYALSRDALHLSITDAVGHDVRSALVATLLVAALRGARRAGCTLDEQAAKANQALLEHVPGATATGQLARVDLTDGHLDLVNAGHYPPLLLRDDQVKPLDLRASILFGAAEGTPFEVQHVPLHPGDRLVLFTDGMVERDAAAVDLADITWRTRALHPREVVRTLTAAVKKACANHLRDDATVACLDWHGPRTNRQAATGADTTTASASPTT
ncbi:PP2C family protein-serine/threonine phosphatase [Actinokineospora bangkokensis]|uniref:Protein phosphatase n=1 Tax=Actinokineospora bangkokensis TaxID=1193682 RepID=A0A1Q9LN61_9PSEU|nr:PP2C family protein-serine/threonine phosphatase [Actinokineospora bangkokensis]OLR93486.1 protein phosphatase [Actinokineospora bangkokensis]